MSFSTVTKIGYTLRQARRLIEREDWSQGCAGGVRTKGPCAAWAIARAGEHEPSVVDPAMEAFANHNGLPFPRPGYNPTQRTTSWNDTLGRTKEQVLAAFRLAEAAEAG